MPWGEDENCPECVAYKALLAEKIEQLIEQGFGHFISGGAMGMDYGKSKVMRSESIETA